MTTGYYISVNETHVYGNPNPCYIVSTVGVMARAFERVFCDSYNEAMCEARRMANKHGLWIHGPSGAIY